MKQNFLNIEKVVKEAFDGDLTIDEVVEAFPAVTTGEFMAIDNMIKENEELFKEGVPFKGDVEAFDKLLESDKYAKLFYDMIVFFN